MEALSVDFSKTILTELMIPSYANFGGKIHGGILLSLMDKAAYACASKHAGNYCVTVSVDQVEFLQPVEVGELVSLTATVHHVGNSSMVIGINVAAENVKTHTVKQTNTCYFTMVAKGDDDKPIPVPALQLKTLAEVKKFAEAIKRKQVKKEANKAFNEAKNAFMMEEYYEMLLGQRCILDVE
ncbi:acyl-CoA thioesterase [Marinoscillum sp. MHG1-6]|uniref:acyl-CoA thioesterase n=1 Tax=Marinoscillum sp. MHG1-6 TaxID=2959627 RepID=UPI0021578655|nr:acyl-CoA thioesterase [Marinoscillum sp. MHG1-6]